MMVLPQEQAQKEGKLAAVAARLQAQEVDLGKQREELLEAQGKLSSDKLALHAEQQALEKAQVRLRLGTWDLGLMRFITWVIDGWDSSVR